MRLEHPSNAQYQMDVTVDGSVIDVNLVHKLKAHSPIDVNPGSMMTVDKLMHSLKASLFIVLTFDGIVIDVNFLRPRNAQEPMVVTLSGIL